MVICLTIAPTCSLQEYEMFQTQNEANLSRRFPIQVIGNVAVASLIILSNNGE